MLSQCIHKLGKKGVFAKVDDIRLFSIVSFLAQWEKRCFSEDASEPESTSVVVSWAKISLWDYCPFIRYNISLRHIRLWVWPPVYLLRDTFIQWSLIFFQESVSVEKVRENSFWSAEQEFCNRHWELYGQKSICNRKPGLKWYNKKKI